MAYLKRSLRSPMHWLLVCTVLAGLALMLQGCGGAKTNLAGANSTSSGSLVPSTSSSPTSSPAVAAPATAPTEPTPAPSPTPTPLPPTTTTSFKFVAWGDTKSGTSALAALSKQIAAFNPPFTIYAGDAESSGFTTTGTDAFIAALNGYANNGTSAKSYLIRGNHDAANTSGWQAYYDFAGVSTTVGAGSFRSLAEDLTYSFDYNNAHFVGIDVPGDANLITSAEISWLDSDLAAAEGRGLTHAFIFFHGPIFCVTSSHCSAFPGASGSYAPQALIDVLNRHAIVSATFHGHEHVLAYVHVDNTRLTTLTHPFEEIIVGSAGAPLYACDQPIRTDWCNSVNGFATVSVSGPSFTVDFYQQGSSSPIRTLNFSK